MTFPQFYDDCRVFRAALPEGVRSCVVWLHVWDLVWGWDPRWIDPPVCPTDRLTHSTKSTKTKQKKKAAAAAAAKGSKSGKGSSQEDDNDDADNAVAFARTDVKGENAEMGDVDESLELVADSPESLRWLVGRCRLSRKRADRCVVFGLGLCV